MLLPYNSQTPCNTPCQSSMPPPRPLSNQRHLHLCACAQGKSSFPLLEWNFEGRTFFEIFVLYRRLAEVHGGDEDRKGIQEEFVNRCECPKHGCESPCIRTENGVPYHSETVISWYSVYSKKSQHQVQTRSHIECQCRGPKSASKRMLKTRLQRLNSDDRLAFIPPYHLPSLPQPLLVVRHRNKILKRGHGALWREMNAFFLFPLFFSRALRHRG